MRDNDFHYRNRTIRVADEVWELAKAVRRKSGLSWNLFIKSVADTFKEYEQKTEADRR